MKIEAAMRVRADVRIIQHELPKDWNITKLGNAKITKVVKAGGTPLTSNRDYWNGDIPFVKIQDMTHSQKYLHKTDTTITPVGLDNSSAWLVPPGSVLLSLYASVGEVIINKIPVATNQAILGIIADESNLDTEFLYYVLSASRGKWTTQQNTQKNLNSEIAKNFLIPVPKLDEQKKIAAIFSRVDDLIQKTDKVIEQTQRLKKGLMQRLLTKGIGHNRFSKLDLLPRYLSFDIPTSWQVTTYGQIAKRITYGFTNPMPEVDEGPWMITATNIHDGRIDYLNARRTDLKAFAELLTDKSRPKVGTVLITKDGTLGEVAIVDRNNICINQSVASIEPNEKILPEYLALSLQSPLTRKLIEVFSPQTTIRHISITDLTEWKLGLPPLDEQKKIVSILSAIGSEFDLKQRFRSRLAYLKRGLMQKLLTGQIRVKV